MDMQAVSSSNIEAVGFDNHTRIMAVKFKGKSLKVYLYYEMTLDLYRKFLAAPSKGRFFEQNIKGKFPTQEAPR